MMTPEERLSFLAERRARMGGSDIAAVLNISPWSTPVSVYLDKLGLSEPKEETEAMRRGTVLEDPVARVYAMKRGYKVFEQRKTIIRDFRVAHIDRVVDIGDGRVFDENDEIISTRLSEMKTSRDEWEGGVPMYYIVQGDWYMLHVPTAESIDFACKSNVFGYSKDTIEMLAKVQERIADSEEAREYYAEFLSRFGDSNFSIYNIRRNDERNARILEIVTDFWVNRVMKARETGDVQAYAPEPESEEDCKALWSRHSPNKFVTFDCGDILSGNKRVRDVLMKVVALAETKAAQKKLKDKCDALQTDIKKVLKDAEGMRDAKGLLLTYRGGEEEDDIDWEGLAKFLKATPEQIKRFTTKKRGSRRFNLSKGIEAAVERINEAVVAADEAGVTFEEKAVEPLPKAEVTEVADEADRIVGETPFGDVKEGSPRPLPMDDGSTLPLTPSTVVAPQKTELEMANELF